MVNDTQELKRDEDTTQAPPIESQIEFVLSYLSEHNTITLCFGFFPFSTKLRKNVPNLSHVLAWLKDEGCVREELREVGFKPYTATYKVYGLTGKGVEKVYDFRKNGNNNGAGKEDKKETLADRWLRKTKDNPLVAILVLGAFLIGIYTSYKPIISYFLPKTPQLHLEQAYPPEDHKVPIDLRTKLARLKFSPEPQPFWLSVVNDGKEVTYDKLTLFIKVQDKFDVEVRKESAGWNVMEPNENFNYFFGTVNPGISLYANPLFVRFPHRGRYKIRHSISAKDNRPVGGVFSVDVY